MHQLDQVREQAGNLNRVHEINNNSRNASECNSTREYDSLEPMKNIEPKVKSPPVMPQIVKDSQDSGSPSREVSMKRQTQQFHPQKSKMDGQLTRKTTKKRGMPQIQLGELVAEDKPNSNDGFSKAISASQPDIF